MRSKQPKQHEQQNKWLKEHQTPRKIILALPKLYRQPRKQPKLLRQRLEPLHN